ncbi:MAG TPA: iron-sulfur cluster assembly accessory protein [Myxococcales bacterium]|jgi:iron-sulfur cluster assembly protein|nr:iron-sulfur cluster assembly accessory protein [Myxococcales bacterium]
MTAAADGLALSQNAAQAVLARARDAGHDGWLLRVAVVAGGCNGLSWELYFVPEALREDKVFESHGVRIAVDAASFPLLEGTVIDLPGRRPAAFQFTNPRARKVCSCGASFEV